MLIFVIHLKVQRFCYCYLHTVRICSENLINSTEVFKIRQVIVHVYTRIFYNWIRIWLNETLTRKSINGEGIFGKFWKLLETTHGVNNGEIFLEKKNSQKLQQRLMNLSENYCQQKVNRNALYRQLINIFVTAALGAVGMQ